MNIKIFIIAVVIIVIMLIYYFFNQIVSIKKIYLPMYNRLLCTESKLNDLDKRTMNIAILTKKYIPQTETPIYSLTYNSEMGKKDSSLNYKIYNSVDKKKICQHINNLSSKKINLKSTGDIINVEEKKLNKSETDTGGFSDDNQIRLILSSNRSPIKSDSIIKSDSKLNSNTDEILYVYKGEIIKNNENKNESPKTSPNKNIDNQYATVLANIKNASDNNTELERSHFDINLEDDFDKLGGVEKSVDKLAVSELEI